MWVERGVKIGLGGSCAHLPVPCPSPMPDVVVLRSRACTGNSRQAQAGELCIEYVYARRVRCLDLTEDIRERCSYMAEEMASSCLLRMPCRTPRVTRPVRCLRSFDGLVCWRSEREMRTVTATEMGDSVGRMQSAGMAAANSRCTG